MAKRWWYPIPPKTHGSSPKSTKRPRPRRSPSLPCGFDPRDLKLLEALSDFAAIALENARHVKKIHDLTIRDDCTTLYNARHMSFILETEIYRSQRYNYEFSLVFIDLDHFKAVNDTHGHLVGSRLLAEI